MSHDGKSNLPRVFERDGAIWTNTRDVAACFGKRHADVLRDVANILENLTDANLRWFVDASYEDEKGERRPAFDLTRDGFTLLVMGYTGPKAMTFKVAYIQQFSDMEKALQDQMTRTTGAVDGLKAVMAEAIRETITEIAPVLIEARIQADPRVGAKHAISTRELLDQRKVASAGRRGLIVQLSTALRDCCLRTGVTAYRCPRTNTWLWPIPAAEAFMRDRGNAMVAAHRDKLRGQGRLRLIPAPEDA